MGQVKLEFQNFENLANDCMFIALAIRHAENVRLFLYFRCLSDKIRRTDKFVKNQSKPVNRVHSYRLEFIIGVG